MTKAAAIATSTVTPTRCGDAAFIGRLAGTGRTVDTAQCGTWVLRGCGGASAGNRRVAVLGGAQRLDLSAGRGGNVSLPFKLVRALSSRLRRRNPISVGPM